MTELPTLYEIRCARCRVTFPPGTSTCFYCGEHLGRPPEGPPPRPPTASEGGQRPLGFRGATTLLWLLFAVAVALFRFCTEGP